MTRVMVADDHSLFRDGIVSLLEAAGFDVVAEAGTGKEIIEAIQSSPPDLVLLDLTMPGMSGLEALKQIRLDHPEVKVVILTVSDDDDDLMAAIQSGASGYLLKDLDSQEFLELLSGLERGEAPMTRKTASRLMSRLATPQHDSARLCLTSPIANSKCSGLCHMAWQIGLSQTNSRSARTPSSTT